jgi:hypothetical protein
MLHEWKKVRLSPQKGSFLCRINIYILADSDSYNDYRRNYLMLTRLHDKGRINDTDDNVVFNDCRNLIYMNINLPKHSRVLR